jgi:hypothetical protein
VRQGGGGGGGGEREREIDRVRKRESAGERERGERKSADESPVYLPYVVRESERAREVEREREGGIKGWIDG